MRLRTKAILILLIPALAVGGFYFYRSYSYETWPRGPKQSEVDFRELADRAKTIRMKNVDSKMWHVEATDWVDFTDRKNDLIPFLKFKPASTDALPHETMSIVELIDAEGQTTQFEIVFMGNGPLAIRWDGNTYVRDGDYLPINGKDRPIAERIYSGESGYVVTMIRDKRETDDCLYKMKVSAGLRPPLLSDRKSDGNRD
jgi:hypothetical protein